MLVNFVDFSICKNSQKSRRLIPLTSPNCQITFYWRHQIYQSQPWNKVVVVALAVDTNETLFNFYSPKSYNFCRSSREARNSWQKCRHNDVKAVGICSVPTDRIFVTRLPCDCNISAAHFKSSTICQMVLIIAKTYGIFGYPRTQWRGSGIIYSQVSSKCCFGFSDVIDP